MTAGTRAPVASDPLSPLVRVLFRELPRCGDLPNDVVGSAPQLLCGAAGSESDGARIEYRLAVADDGRVIDVRFRAYGCPHTLATAAWLAEQLLGRSLENLLPSAPADWADALGVPVHKLGRLLLIEDAVRAISTVNRGL